jgi:Protein of unknown function (DUF1552)
MAVTQRIALAKNTGSILDSVAQEATRLAGTLGPVDRTKLNEYLDSVRDIKPAALEVRSPSLSSPRPAKSSHLEVQLSRIQRGRQSDFAVSYGYAVALNDNKNEAMERTIEVAGISDELLALLDRRARQIGVDRNSYVRKLIERAVAPPSSAATLAELLAPIHDFTEAHGISEAEVERFFSAQVAGSRRQRRRVDESGGSE